MKKFSVILLLTLCLACSSSDDSNSEDNNQPTNYRQLMRELVIGISAKAKAERPGFYIIPQNGIELVANSDNDFTPNMPYLQAIDGNGQEDLWYGYDNDDDATPSETTNYLKAYLNISKGAGNTILVTDYCSTPSKMADSYRKNIASGYVSYAAPERNLSVVPPGAPQNESNGIVTQLNQVQNFLYLINPEHYNNKQEFVNAIAETNYDLVIVDLFYEDAMLTNEDVEQLKMKANGGKRLVICYMSIGEAEDYRYYWNSNWNVSAPAWIAAENPDWPGNYKVNYWNTEWQDIIYRKSDSYLNKVLASGFDGVYLDIIDAFEYFEE